jgi:hypothetical protein
MMQRPVMITCVDDHWLFVPSIQPEREEATELREAMTQIAARLVDLLAQLVIGPTAQLVGIGGKRTSPNLRQTQKEPRIPGPRVPEYSSLIDPDQIG